MTSDNGSAFEKIPPEGAGITSASVLNLLDTLRSKRINIHSLMILRHGKVLTALWWKPYRPELPHQLYSFSKSVLSAAVGIAVDEGRISRDDRVASFFRRAIDRDADERIYSMTIKHLLTMTSGAVAQNEVTMYRQTDWVDWFLNTPLNHFPGERFVYNSLNSYMLSVILRKITGEGLVNYLMPRLFQPLGIERPMWDTCPMGIECGGWGLYLTTEDMAKFCQLCLDDGVWKGRRVLPQGWAAEAGDGIVPSTTDGKLNDSCHRSGGYGHHFWRNSDGMSWRADGMFGQFGLVIPHKDMVVVTTAGHAAPMEVLDVLWNEFFPQVDAVPEGTSPGEDYDELCRFSDALTTLCPVQSVRSLERERMVNGVSYSFPINSHSLLPLSVRFLHRVKNLGVASMRLDFGDTCSMLCWTEGGVEQCVPFALDGTFCHGTLTYAHRSYPVVTTAAWIAPDTVEIGVRLINTAHMNRLLLRFNDEGVICTFDEDPSLENMLKMAFELSRPMRPIAQRMARFVRHRMPGIRGVIKQTAENQS